MLLPKDTNPINSIYFNGGNILNTLISIRGKRIDFFKLYEKVKSSNEISLQTYILTLDWLYLLGSIKLDDNGKIVKCF
ncbi:ABC-three component system middle component 6 [Mucilaginibacter aquatilis]|uniref:ABC-three component system middle component 6 n=1 Tax=Mucilaginibacter aquatilis TaxID=1517760 RepID=UPI0037439D3D